MEELLEYIKEKFANNDKDLINAFVYGTPEAFITYVYELLIVEFNAPFGKAVYELAEEFYYETMQPWVVQMKLFNPLLK